MQVQKFGGPPKTIGGQKRAKISFDFIHVQPHTLIANISGTAQDIQNGKDTVSRSIPPPFSEKGSVNFGPLITETKM